MAIKLDQGGSLTLDMRSDLNCMLMPFFPEETNLREFETHLNGYSIKITSDNPEISIATPSDRKILNLLAGAVARNIRSGGEPSRHIAIDTRTIIETLSDEGSVGGSQYTLVLDRLKRLMSTIIETEMPLGDGVSRRRRFRWIDAFEHEDKNIPGGRRMLGLQISISEDAFLWMTRSLGFDISRRDFQSLTSSRSSIWRTYEICLARLISNQGTKTYIPIDHLRIRIPITSPLKAFKSRTLRTAFEAIKTHPEMSSHIKLSLAVSRPNGIFETIDFSQRARFDSLFIAVSKGDAPLPHLNRILAQSDVENLRQSKRSVDVML